MVARPALVRLCQFGYTAEDGLYRVPFQADVTRIKLHKRIYTPLCRDIVAVSTGCHFEGGSRPRPNPDQFTSMVGCTKRMCLTMPKAKRTYLRRLKRFAYRLLVRNFRPLDYTRIYTRPEWVETRPYPEWRKAELRDVIDNTPPYLVPKIQKVGRFSKYEAHNEYKDARSILPRTDEFKTLFGPYTASVEREVFSKTDRFIKKVPVEERPKHLEELFAGHRRFMITDYSSYEQSFKEEIMESLDIVMFKFFFKDFSRDSLVWQLFQSLKETNKISDTYVTIFREAQRMSGEMNTSLSNGFANLCVGLFLCSEMGYPPDKVRLIVEGDDGIMAVPDDGDFPNSQMYADLGFIIKRTIVNSIGEGSFCGLLYESTARDVLVDPFKALAAWGFASFRYKAARDSTLKMLLRAKALSYLHEYRCCPIIGALGEYGCRVTSGISINKYLESRNLGDWERQKLIVASQTKDFRRGDVKMESRLFMEEKFGITVEQQLEIEAIILNKNEISPFTLDLQWPKDISHNFENFCHYTDVNNDATQYIGRKVSLRRLSDIFKKTWRSSPNAEIYTN